MKFVLCLLFIYTVCYVQAASISTEQLKKIEEWQKICAEEIGADPDLIINARNGDFADDQKLKDYLFCVSKKAGFQNEAGQPQSDVLKAKIAAAVGDDSKAETLVNACVKTGANGPDTAFIVFKCSFGKTGINII